MSLVLMLLALLAPVQGRAADKYAVQFIVPSGKEDVWKFVEMISNLNYPAYMFTNELGGEKHYYAHMGTYDSIVEAIDAAVALQKKVRVEYEVVLANTNKVVELRKHQDKNQEEKTKGAAREDLPAPDALPEKASVDSLVEPYPASKPTPFESAAPAEAPEPAPKNAAREPITASAPKPVTAKQEPAPAPEKKTALAKPQPVMKSQDKPVVKKTEAPKSEQLPPPSVASSGQKTYLLALHSFSQKENAIKTARKYSQKGYDAIIILLYDNNHTPWYIVSPGHFNDSRSAKDFAREFSGKENRFPDIKAVDAQFLQTRVIPYSDHP